MLFFDLALKLFIPNLYSVKRVRELCTYVSHAFVVPMGNEGSDEWVTRDVETRAVRLTADTASLESAVSLLEIMKLDRPHMAMRLSKLVPKTSDDERNWSVPVLEDRVHLWALKAVHGSLSKLVAVIWFELVGGVSSAQQPQKKDVLSTDSRNPTTAHIEVLWTRPDIRQCGFGSRLVQSVLVRYPGISKWTAFTSRDMKKDAGVHKFWKKNGFFQESLEVGKVNQDGFFVRNSATETSKRRRVPIQLFEIKETDITSINDRKRKREEANATPQRSS